MHPVILGDLAQDHVTSLTRAADADRLAHDVAGGGPGVLRRRMGAGLIALGNRLACDSAGVAPVHGGRA